MKPFILPLLAVVVIVPCGASALRLTHPTETAGTPALVANGNQEQKGRNLIMQMKLGHAQKVLEGIAIKDFDLMEKHADELIILSKKAEWRVLATPMYVLRSGEFRRNAEDLVKSATEKNLDAAALAYVQLTMSCVNCHKHVRETRVARLD